MAASAGRRNLVAMSEQMLVQHVIGERPADVNAGASILGWRVNKQFSAPIAVVFIECNVAAQLTAPANGDAVELFGYRSDSGIGWRRIGYLNDAQLISVKADLIGYAQQVDVLGIFERLCVAATVSAGQAIARFAPMEYFS